MNNRITELFRSGKKNLLSIYYTAGYPELNDTVNIAASLEKAGVDMLEIGFPFSDPLADGPIIQQSSEQSLRNGMTVNILFEQLKDLRKRVNIPVLLMGYLNPVVQYGVENFCRKCAELGIDGLILPDLPMQEYEISYRQLFEQCNLSNIFLITPESSEERIRIIDKLGNGFVYALSSSSTTGKQMNTGQAAENYFKKLKNMGLNNPIMIGFGVSDRKSFENVTQYASGAIIGSAFVRHLNEKGKDQQSINDFVKSIIT